MQEDQPCLEGQISEHLEHECQGVRRDPAGLQFSAGASFKGGRIWTMGGHAGVQARPCAYSSLKEQIVGLKQASRQY